MIIAIPVAPTQPRTCNLIPELVVQLLVREFVSHTGIDFCVVSQDYVVTEQHSENC